METKIRTFGKYQLIAHLASGGMAEIFLARQRGIGGFEKLLVIKKILPHMAQEKLFVKMFLDEARIAAQINHQNVVQIYDLGCEEDQYFIAMEYLEGDSLGALLRRARKAGRPIPPFMSAGIALQVADGLHHAHSLTGPDSQPLNVVHRDVTPQNVFVLYSGLVKLVDFGIAKAAKRFSQTEAGTLKGKYGYMSPEQVMGLVLDARSDIYSLGVVFWEMLTGRRMYRSSMNELEILKAVAERDPPPPSTVLESVPRELEEICMKALKRSRDLRYQTAAELRLELSMVLKTRKEPSDTVAIGEFVQSLFYDQIAQKRQLIKDAQSQGANLAEGLFSDLIPEASTADVISDDFGWNLSPPGGTPAPQSIESSAEARARAQGFRTETSISSSNTKPLRRRFSSGILTAVIALSAFVALWLYTKENEVPGLPAAAVNQPGTAAPPPAMPALTAPTAPPSAKPAPEPAASRSTPELAAEEEDPPLARPVPAAKDPKRPPTKAQKSSQPGRLRLDTNPWTNVYWRQKNLGPTPLVDLEMPAGTWTLRLVNEEKGINTPVSVVIKPNETTSKSVRF